MWPFAKKPTENLQETNTPYGIQVLGSQVILTNAGRGIFQLSYPSVSNTTAAGQQVDVDLLFRNGAFSASNSLITHVIGQMTPKIMYFNDETAQYEDALSSKAIGRVDRQKAKQVTNLFRRPNSFQSSYEFLAQCAMWINAMGELFVLNWRNNQDDMNETPKEMFVLDAQLTSVRTNQDHRPTYFYSGATPNLFGKQDEFKDWQVTHITEQPWQGQSGFSKLIYTAELVNLSQQIHQYSNFVIANSMKPSGIFSTSTPVPDNKLKEMAARIKESWNQLVGSRDSDLSKAGQALILDSGFTYNPIEPPKFADDSMIKLKEQVDKQICGILGVPPGLVGIGMAEKYNNSQTARDEFYRSTIYPTLTMMAQKFTMSFFKNYPNLKVEFNTGEFLKGDALAQAQYAGSMVNNGIMTVNEAREYVGLGKLPNMDTLQPMGAKHAEPDGDEPDMKKDQDTGGGGGSPAGMVQAPKLKAVK